MKTTLAIMLAAGVLISGATVSVSGAALAHTLGAASAQLWCTKGCPPSAKHLPTDRFRGR